MKKNKETALHVKYLILGGGITGLSTAYHLEKAHQTDYLVVEKNNFLGGLCASEHIQGFTFDFAGHLLHLHHPYTKNLVRGLLKDNIQKTIENVMAGDFQLYDINDSSFPQSPLGYHDRVRTIDRHSTDTTATQLRLPMQV